MAVSARTLARIYLDEIFNKGDFDLIEKHFSPQYAYHGSGGQEFKGWAELKKFLGTHKTAFPDAHTTVDDVIDGGNKIAVRFSFSGTHRGPLGEIKPSGKKVKASAITVLRLSRGKIAEEWEVMEELQMMQQIGAVPK